MIKIHILSNWKFTSKLFISNVPGTSFFFIFRWQVTWKKHAITDEKWAKFGQKGLFWRNFWPRASVRGRLIENFYWLKQIFDRRLPIEFSTGIQSEITDIILVGNSIGNFRLNLNSVEILNKWFFCFLFFW